MDESGDSTSADPPGGLAVGSAETSAEAKVVNARIVSSSSVAKSRSMISDGADPPGGPASTTRTSCPLSPNVIVNVVPSTSQTVTNINKSNQTGSFASALKKDFVFPKKDQAIVLNAIEGIKIGDYLEALGAIVKPRNIMFASHMSNNRVCFYLSSASLVDSFINNHAGVNIENLFIPARRLVSPAKRIIISNVCPCIPHNHLEALLKDNNLKVVSPVSFMRVGAALDEYKHVLSFRRQVYVVLETNDKLPETLLVDFEDEKYRIFLSTDEMRCYRCKSVGHISTNCPQSVHIPSTTEVERATPVTANTDNVMLETQTDMECIITVPNSDPDFLIPNESNVVRNRRPSVSPTGKRLADVLDHEETSSMIDSEDSTTSTQRLKPKMKKKKTKTTKPTKEKDSNEGTDNESLKASSEMWMDGTTHVLTYAELKEFLAECKGTEKKLEIAQKYTNDIEGLSSLLGGVIKKLGNGALKERCKRLVAHFTKVLNSQTD